MATEKDIVRKVMAAGHTDVVKAAVRLLISRYKMPGELNKEELDLLDEVVKMVGWGDVLDAVNQPRV